MNNSLQPVMEKRRTLRQAALISVTSPLWVKPVVNAVILPSHAQTTTTTSNSGIQVVIDIIVPDILGLKQSHKD
ncbi:MAG: hypothetical protein ACI9J2_000050 [Saprospiraceae bacterium]|jgi:hypothetical protein